MCKKVMINKNMFKVIIIYIYKGSGLMREGEKSKGLNLNHVRFLQAGFDMILVKNMKRKILVLQQFH